MVRVLFIQCFFGILPHYRRYLKGKGHLAAVLSHFTDFLLNSLKGLFSDAILRRVDSNKKKKVSVVVSMLLPAANKDNITFYLWVPFFIYIKAKGHSDMRIVACLCISFSKFSKERLQKVFSKYPRSFNSFDLSQDVCYIYYCYEYFMIH